MMTYFYFEPGMTVGLGDVATWRSLLQGIPDLYNYNALFAAENIFALERKRYSFVLDLLSWCLRNFFIPQSGIAHKKAYQIYPRIIIQYIILTIHATRA